MEGARNSLKRRCASGVARSNAVVNRSLGPLAGLFVMGPSRDFWIGFSHEVSSRALRPLHICLGPRFAHDLYRAAADDGAATTCTLTSPAVPRALHPEMHLFMQGAPADHQSHEVQQSRSCSSSFPRVFSRAWAVRGFSLRSQAAHFARPVRMQSCAPVLAGDRSCVFWQIEPGHLVVLCGGKRM